MTELFKDFLEFRRILCLCPCCGEIKRVSDLKLKTKGKGVQTWLDEFESKERSVEKKEDKFAEIAADLRQKATERGRLSAEKAINSFVSPSLKALKLDPFDIKAIMNPIDFIVFKGMTKHDEIDQILLLSKQVKNNALNTLRSQVEKAVKNKAYDWNLARIGEKGKIEFD